jgi:hypothetical protein
MRQSQCHLSVARSSTFLLLLELRIPRRGMIVSSSLVSESTTLQYLPGKVLIVVGRYKKRGRTGLVRLKVPVVRTVSRKMPPRRWLQHFNPQSISKLPTEGTLSSDSRGFQPLSKYAIAPLVKVRIGLSRSVGAVFFEIVGRAVFSPSLSKCQNRNNY